jgi:hypothetical protein
MEEKKTTVEMTAEEAALFDAFRAHREKEEAESKRKADREAYRRLVDETVTGCFPALERASRMLADLKRDVYAAFDQALELKEQLFEVRDDQRSHTFINTASTHRIMLGNYTVDGYDDTVEEGISIVKEFLGTLAKDEQSHALINTILRLLSRDVKGNLKASRVLQLQKTADELGADRLLEGVRIIREAYRPEISKRFLRAEYKNDHNAWVNVPLGVTES